MGYRLIMVKMALEINRLEEIMSKTTNNFKSRKQRKYLLMINLQLVYKQSTLKVPCEGEAGKIFKIFSRISS